MNSIPLFFPIFYLLVWTSIPVSFISRKQIRFFGKNPLLPEQALASVLHRPSNSADAIPPGLHAVQLFFLKRLTFPGKDLCYRKRKSKGGDFYEGGLSRASARSWYLSIGQSPGSGLNLVLIFSFLEISKWPR